MPLYEYTCSACGKVSEILQKLAAPDPTACPSCQKGPLRKILSQSAFALKGSGWYKDAYAGRSNQDAKKDSGSKSESSASSGGDNTSNKSTGDSKPEAKTLSPNDSPSKKGGD